MKDALYSRLDALSRKVDDTGAQLKAKALWHDGHHLTAGELKARYAYLQSELSGEVIDLEAHGRHVSDLERAVREWVEGLEL